MKSIIFLAVIFTIYYQVNKRYPEKLTKKNHIYFGIFCAIYLTILYLFKYQKIFVYRIFKSIKDVDEKPLYDMNSVIYKENQMVGLKNNLSMRQGWRCISCQNPILQKDLHLCSINYIKPLQFGGKNDISNLSVSCGTCSNFVQY